MDPDLERERYLADRIAQVAIDMVRSGTEDDTRPLLLLVSDMSNEDRRFVVDTIQRDFGEALEAEGMAPVNSRACLGWMAVLLDGERLQLFRELLRDQFHYGRMLWSKFQAALDISTKGRRALMDWRSRFQSRLRTKRVWFGASVDAAANIPLIEKTLHSSYGLIWFLYGYGMQKKGTWDDIGLGSASGWKVMVYDKPEHTAYDPMCHLMRFLRQAPPTPIAMSVYRHLAGLHVPGREFFPHPAPHSSTLREAFAVWWPGRTDHFTGTILNSSSICCLLEIRLPAGYPCFYYGPPPYPFPGSVEQMVDATGFRKPQRDPQFEVVLPPANYRIVEKKIINLGARAYHVPEFYEGSVDLHVLGENFKYAMDFSGDPNYASRTVYVVEPVPMKTMGLEVGKCTRQHPYAQMVLGARGGMLVEEFRQRFERVLGHVEKIVREDRDLNSVRFVVSEEGLPPGMFRDLEWLKDHEAALFPGQQTPLAWSFTKDVMTISPDGPEGRRARAAMHDAAPFYLDYDLAQDLADVVFIENHKHKVPRARYKGVRDLYPSFSLRSHRIPGMGGTFKIYDSDGLLTVDADFHSDTFVLRWSVESPSWIVEMRKDVHVGEKRPRDLRSKVLEVLAEASAMIKAVHVKFSIPIPVSSTLPFAVYSAADDPDIAPLLDDV